MNETFYGIKLAIKIGALTDEPADAYISDISKDTPAGQKMKKLCSVQAFEGHGIFEDIFRRTLEALCLLDTQGKYPAVAVERFTKGIHSLNNYQIVRAILCGMYGFCQVSSSRNIRTVTLVISPEDWNVAEEIWRTQTYKTFFDPFKGEPDMHTILCRDYGLKK